MGEHELCRVLEHNSGLRILFRFDGLGNLDVKETKCRLEERMLHGHGEGYFRSCIAKNVDLKIKWFYGFAPV